MRVDRDRQGVIRVFQGATPVAPAAEVQTEAPREVEAPVVVGEAVIVEADVPEPDLSVGPGNVEQPAIVEASKRRGRVPGPRTRAAGPRRPRKKAE